MLTHPADSGDRGKSLRLLGRWVAFMGIVVALATMLMAQATTTISGSQTE